MAPNSTSLSELSSSEMASWLTSRLPGRTIAVLDAIDNLQGYLYPEEDALLSRAVLKRSREFRSGRTAARKCMLQLGIEPAPVLVGTKREPVWPAGCTGTISHCGDHCLAIVGPADVLLSLGADIENLGRVREHLWPRVFTAREIAGLDELGSSDADLAATTMFSAKEAFFKLQYPLTGSWLEFLDAEVSLRKANTFTVTVKHQLNVPSPGQAFPGTYAEWQDCVITVMGV